MKLCPHCGTELRDNARFCTACMTPLNEKRVIPHTRYVSLRWLPIAAAVLALVVAVQWLPQALRLPVQSDSSISNGTAISTSASTSPTGDDNPTVPEVTGSTADAPGTTLGGRPGNIHIYQPGADGDVTTDPYDWDVGKGTTYNTGTTSRTTTKKPSTTTTTKKSSTTTTTTTTSTTTTTRPYWYDATPASVTEDDLPIEELEWTYKPITSTKWTFSQYRYEYRDSHYGYTTRTATASGVPLNQCITVTGFKSPASNGIYRVPAMIDGKVVAAVDLTNSFTDTAVALTVKRIYFPPDMLHFYGGTDTCTNLERLYFTSPEAYFAPSCIPEQPTRQWGGVTYYFLTIYRPWSDFKALRVGDLYSNVFLYACKGNTYDAEAGIIKSDECEKLYGGGGT